MRYTPNRSLVIFIALLVGLMADATRAQDPPKTLLFGVVPQQSTYKLAASWGPLLRHLGDRSGIALKFATASTIPEFEARLAEGRYDIAYVNPYHYTRYHAQPGYRAFAKQRDVLLQGIIVVRKDSPIRSVRELQGATMAFPAPNAFAATLLLRRSLNLQGIQVTPKYVTSHDSVYRTVAKGLYPAGGGVFRTFNAIAAPVGAQLKVLWVSESYSPHAFIARSRVPNTMVAKLLRAMLSLEEDKQGRALLDRLGFKGIEAASPEQWQDVFELELDELDEDEAGEPVPLP